MNKQAQTFAEFRELMAAKLTKQLQVLSGNDAKLAVELLKDDLLPYAHKKARRVTRKMETANEFDELFNEWRNGLSKTIIAIYEGENAPIVYLPWEYLFDANEVEYCDLSKSIDFDHFRYWHEDKKKTQGAANRINQFTK